MASDLGLHCLPRPHKRDVRLIWVKRAYPDNTGTVSNADACRVQAIVGKGCKGYKELYHRLVEYVCCHGLTIFSINKKRSRVKRMPFVMITIN